MSSATRGLIFGTGSLMIATLISKGIGFGRDVAIGYYFGAGGATDAYFVALALPTVIAETFLAAVNTSYIPLYMEASIEGDKRRFTNALVTSLLVLLGSLSVLGVVGSPWLVRIIAPGFDAERLRLAATLSAIMFPLLIARGVGRVYLANLQANRRFFASGLYGIPENLIILAGLVFAAAHFGIPALAVATLVGAVARVAFVYAFVNKEERFAFIGAWWREEHLRKMLRLIVPVVAATLFGQINVVVDRFLGSGLSEGSIAALSFASRLQLFVYGILSSSVVTTSYSHFAKLASEANRDALVRAVDQVMGAAALLLLPVSLLTAVLAGEAVQIVFQRGAFDLDAVVMTAGALACYAAGIVPIGLRDILNRTFFAIQDTKTPMILGTIPVVVNIGLSLLLVSPLGHLGLALGNSLAGLLGFLLLWWAIRKRLAGVGTVFGAVLRRAVLGLLFLLTTVFWVKSAFAQTSPSTVRNLAMLLGVGASGIVAYLLPFLVRPNPAVRELFGHLRHRLRKADSLQERG